MSTSTLTTIPGTTRPRRASAITAYTKTLWDNRRSLLAWALAAGLLTMLYASFYPQMTTTAIAIPDTLDGFGFADTTSAVGYLTGAVFGLVLPLLVTFYGVATGTRTTSADEESGILDLLLAHPLSRTRLLLERNAALATGAVLIAAVFLGGLLAVRTGAHLNAVSPADIAAQTVHLALLALLFGALASGLGAATAGPGEPCTASVPASAHSPMPSTASHPSSPTGSAT